ncbi:hypothetical protein BASA50_000206 [Batrachochytrium salamandrivorans]|uniref:Uncharacterized protein n=1 Tax=Batrachochytrium salamandrivorans TaxID=1357716 RepID=A0ABQ8EUI3_9FUNG|nr:hypothetical protein BASA50_000206 [Batrachochytrium salamandrivorans]
MQTRNNWDPNSEDYYYKKGDWVKLKHHSKNKFEFDWKGPYFIADIGHPGTYWLMEPSGRRFDATINESDLAPWIQSNHSNLKFSDGTHRTEFIDNEQKDSDFGQEDFIEQEHYDMEKRRVY